MLSWCNNVIDNMNTLDQEYCLSRRDNHVTIQYTDHQRGRSSGRDLTALGQIVL